MIGAHKAINLCYLLLAVHSMIILCSGFSLGLRSGVLLCNLGIALVLRQLVFRNADRYHYAFLLDFALVMQFVLVWGVSFVL